MENTAHNVLWHRIKYALTPQWDIYKSLATRLKGKSVLEVGFGTGAGVLQYASSASYIDAIEIDKGAVDFAESTFPIANINWIHDDILTFDNYVRYEAVVMIEVLEHIGDWRKALENVELHMIGGGQLYITARNANADLRRGKDLHLREWTADEFQASLLEVFDKCWLWDYSFTHLQKDDTRLTPLVAIARSL